MIRHGEDTHIREDCRETRRRWGAQGLRSEDGQPGMHDSLFWASVLRRESQFTQAPLDVVELKPRINSACATATCIGSISGKGRLQNHVVIDHTLRARAGLLSRTERVFLFKEDFEIALF